MLSPLVAHAGQPLLPHDLWRAWTFDPLVLIGLAVAVLCYARGVRPGGDPPWRRAAFAAGWSAVVVALVSPLDALSGALFAAHMAQHVVLVLIAAPLLAVAAPGAALVRGTPSAVRGGLRQARRRAGLDAGRIDRLRSPIARWLLFVGTFWVWHAAALYRAALEHAAVHAVEHALFFGTALALWSALLGPTRARTSRGGGVLAVFGLALQSVFLSALVTFSSAPWYAPYTRTAPAWGLDPLTDQQLAGLIMWVPAGFIHVGVALALLASWLRELDRGEPLRASAGPATR